MRRAAAGGHENGLAPLEAEAVFMEMEDAAAAPPLRPGWGGRIERAGVAAMAGGAQAGELFEYVIKDPLTLPAAICHAAIVNESIKGKRGFDYNQAVNDRYLEWGRV
jgi:hypothetical protein